MRILVIALMMVLAASSVCFSGEYASAYGTDLTCGDISRGTTDMDTGMHAYVSGFISGVNFESTRDTSQFGADDLLLWVKKYCEDHPLDKFVVAVMALNKDLNTRLNR